MYDPSVRLLRQIMALGLLLICTACATVQGAKDPLQGEQDLNAGTVLLSLTLNTGEAQQFQSIYLSREEDKIATETNAKIQYVLGNVVPGISRDTALFIGSLPEGTYHFVTLHAVGKFLRVNEKQDEVIGSFKVEAGKTVDLGRIILTAVNYKVMFGRSNLIKDNRQLV